MNRDLKFTLILCSCFAAAVLFLFVTKVKAEGLPIPSSVTIADSQSTSSAAAGAQAGAIGIQINAGGGGGVDAQGNPVATSAVAGGTARSAGGAAVAGSGFGMGGHGGSSSANNAGNSQAIVFNTEAPDLGEQVPGIVAPALTTTLSGTCFGSASGGVAGAGFGVTLGKTYEDKECQRRLNANSLNALGLSGLAMEVMCGTPEVLKADARMPKPVCAQNQASVGPTEQDALRWDGGAYVAGLMDYGIEPPIGGVTAEGVTTGK